MLSQPLPPLDPGTLAEWVGAGAAVVAAIGAAAVGIYAARLAWKAAQSGERTALRVSTFQHTDKLYVAIRKYSRLVVTGTMPQVLQEWNLQNVETEAQAAVFEYLDALESLLLAVEEGAADRRIAERYVQPILSYPQEMLDALAIYRARAGHVPEIYEVLERTLKRGHLAVLPRTGDSQ